MTPRLLEPILVTKPVVLRSCGSLFIAAVGLLRLRACSRQKRMFGIVPELFWANGTSDKDGTGCLLRSGSSGPKASKGTCPGVVGAFSQRFRAETIGRCGDRGKARSGIPND